MPDLSEGCETCGGSELICPDGHGDTIEWIEPRVCVICGKPGIDCPECKPKGESDVERT